MHILTDNEIAERGYPKVAGLKYFSDGTVEYSYVRQQPYSYSMRVGSHDSYNDVTMSYVEHVSVTAKGKIISFDGNSLVTKTTEVVNIGTDYHNFHNSDWQNSQHKEVHRPKQTEIYHAFNEKGRVCSASNVDVGSTDTLQPTQDVCAAAFKSWKDHFVQGTDSANRVLGNGGIIYAPNSTTTVEDVQKHVKNLGIDINDQTIKMKKEIEAESNINADGKITATGDIEAGGNIHAHGNEIVDGDSRIHGSSEIDKDNIVHGNQHINGNQEVDKDQTIHGNQTVDSDSRIHGNQVIDKDATVYGDTNMKGDAKVDRDLQVKGDTQLGDDKNKDRFDVWAKTHLHGDTTVGDDEKDKFTVNATSEFKADATFDKNVKIKGDIETDGNSTTHGNATIDKDLHVKGNSETDGNALVHGNGVVEGDFEVKGNTKLGDDKNKDTLDVNAKTHLHGDTTIGDDKNDKLTINATTEFAGESTFGKDVHIKGNLETDGDSRTHGNSVTEGNAIVYGNAGVAQDLTVGGNSHVFGDSVVDGGIYGRSFNVGDERYIDKDGINANNHKIRNVADGEIGPNSLDAVNGRQLWNTREGLQHNINQVGAQTAAMANLHPMDFEYGDKFSLAAAVGGYQNQQAFALGAFVKPTQKSMFSLTGTLGMSQNMYGVGYTQKFGKKADFEHMTQTQLQDELAKLDKDANEIREHDKQIKAENETLRNASRVLAESIDTNSAEIGRLKAVDEKMRAENVALRDENKALKGEIAELRADNKELAKNLAQNSKGDAEMSAKLAQNEEKVSFLQKAVDGLKA